MALGASLGNPMASAFTTGMTAWPSTAWMSPMMAWTNGMMPRSAMGGPLVSTNIVDFESAYAAYRTAGGHAAAQIIRNISAPSPIASSAQADTSAMLPWIFPFAMFGALPWRP
jgi:hypothetical protein